MSAIQRLASIELEAPDLGAEAEHYEHILGLRLVERGKDRLHFGLGNDGVSLSINQGAVKRCTALAFEASADGLASLEKKLGGAGVASKVKSDGLPGRTRSLTFTDPKGTQLEVFTADTKAAAGYAKGGIIPNKLGHVAFSVEDLPPLLNFYRDVLGFKVSDWLGDFFVFLRCGPDHHTCNFVGNSKATKMHHMAYEVRDFAAIRDACDFLSARGYPIVWGPVRHGCGHNISIYYRDPAGHMIELFCELDRIPDETTEYFEPRPWHQEFPQGPKTWTNVLQAASQWGTPLPDGFLD